MADASLGRCPSCGAGNRVGAKFCDECGAALKLSCSGCGTELRLGAKFCDECGRLVGGGPLAPAAMPGLPSDLTEKVLASRESLEGERKQVTVLFADVKGSMDLQADLDPEEWARIMGRFVDILADGVHRFEGAVDKFTGDGIMALFGAPIAFEDHARRACHAALYLTEAIGRLRRRAPENTRAELPRPPGAQLRRGRGRPYRRRRAHGVHGHRPDGGARSAHGDARQTGQRLSHSGHGASRDGVLSHEGPRRRCRSRACRVPCTPSSSKASVRFARDWTSPRQRGSRASWDATRRWPSSSPPSSKP